MKRARDICLMLILITLTARVMWWSLEPFLPLLGALFLILTLFGVIYYRLLKW